MKYLITTRIDGIVQYVRRSKITNSGFVSVSMTTTNTNKAKAFEKKEQAEKMLNRMGIGYWISEIE